MKTLFKVKKGNLVATVKTDSENKLYVTYTSLEKGIPAEYEYYEHEFAVILAKIKVGFLEGYTKIYKDGKALNWEQYRLWSY